MTTEKIDLEVAENEFERWRQAMGIEFFEGRMDNDDKKDFTLQRDRLIAAVQSGALVVDDKGQFVYTPQREWDGPPITFYEPSGAALMAMDYKKKDKDVGKMFNSMADMTKTDAKTFSRMKMADLNVCTAIAILFLA